MTDFQIREAERDDLEAIVRLHEEDELGGHGDAWTAENRRAYEDAFAAIQRSPDNRLFVALQNGEVVGTFQLTFIPNLTGRGALRTKVESVKVKRSKRSLGIGARMMDFAANEARAGGASLLELTSRKSRKEAHRFYERIGYSPSHEGFKKKL